MLLGSARDGHVMGIVALCQASADDFCGLLKACEVSAVIMGENEKCMWLKC